MASLRGRIGKRANPIRWRCSWLLVAAIGGGAAAGGCGSNSTVATGPTPLKCQVALAATASSIGPDGGTGTITVTASPECPWDVATGANWLSSLSPTSGQGTGTVEFRAAPNPLPSVREGDIVVNDNRFRVSQQAAACRLELRSVGLTIDAGGGAREVAVAATSGCPWTAATDASWLSFTTSASGSGDGNVGVRIAPNPGDERRVGTIVVGDQRFTVTQEAETPGPSGPPAPGCVYSISSTSQAVLPSGGAELSASVTVANGCAWTASSSVAWVTVVAGASGTGSGIVAFSVAANPGSARTGTVAVAGQRFSVNQAAAAATAPCTYALSAPEVSLTAAGGSGTVAVTAGEGCSWTARSSAAWVTVTSGASSSGNGAVAFSVAPNPGAARTGTISIAGQTVTVRQAAAPVLCSYAISPPSASLAAAGGTGSLAVTTGDGCNWTASSGAAWVAITSDISGSGNGAVTFSVAPNSGAARTGTVSIAGQTVTVNQEAAPPPCTCSIAQPNGSFGALGGTGTVSISTGAGCAWRATSNAAWIVVTAGANSTGSGAVGFSVLVNLLGARTGTLTVAGETFTVHQAGVLGDQSGQIVSTRQEH